MANLEGGGVQLPLRKEAIHEVFVFHAGAYPIYPKYSYAGAPTETFEAIRINGKIQRLNAYESITPIHLYHRGTDGRDHFWQLGVGTKFGAYSVKAHKRKV